MRALRNIIICVGFSLPLLMAGQIPGSGHSLVFGTNKYIDLGNAYSGISLPVAVSVWFKPSSTAPTQRIFFSHTAIPGYAGFWFQIAGGKLEISMGDGTSRTGTGRRTGYSSVSLQINRWYHLAGVIYSATNMELYVNGDQLVESYDGTGMTTMYLNTSSGMVGRNTAGNNIKYLDGQLDELSVWDKALTATEIRSLMCRKLIGNESGLVGYYRFDNATGNTLTNLAGSVNGTLINSPSWTLSGAPVGDRSNFLYNNNPVSLTSLAGDSVVANPSAGGINGLHVYMVDQLTPSAQQQNLNLVPGVNHYFGVFTVDPSKTVDIEYFPNSSLASTYPGDLQLATRADNAQPAWAVQPPRNSPSIALNSQVGPRQFSLHFDPCGGQSISLGSDTSICAGDTYLLDPGLPSTYNYTWSTGDSSSTLSITQGGTYWVQVIDNNGCYLQDTVVVASLNPFSDYLPNDTTVCDSLGMILTGSLVNWQWSNGSLTQNFVTLSSGQFWFQALDTTTGCMVSDSMNVTVVNSANLPNLLPDDTLICGLPSTILDATLNGAVSYIWNNGAGGPQIQVTKGGLYSVEVLLPGGCRAVDTVRVTFSKVEKPLGKYIYYLCPGKKVTLELDKTKFYSAQWSNGTVGLKAEFSTIGTFWVSAQNPDGCVVGDTFSIEEAVPLPNKQIFSDTSFCFNSSLKLKAPDTLNITWPDGSDTTYTVRQTEVVKVRISDGCTENEEFFEVRQYQCECEVKFANAFTPNGDGLNDFFRAETECEFLTYQLEIFDRFGRRVFYSQNREKAFEGRTGSTDLPLGVYTYSFHYTTPHTSGRKLGYLSLMR